MNKAITRALAPETCAVYGDLRDVIARKDIDAVMIATGDRWHAPASIMAMHAGKDVYCEKPGALTIAEGQALVASEQRFGRIFQAGAQRASNRNFIIAEGQFRWNITVPPNTTATLHVPVRDAEKVLESGKPLKRLGEAKFLRMEGGRALFEVDSGSYRLSGNLDLSIGGAASED